jgi:hypothetical protein
MRVDVGVFYDNYVITADDKGHMYEVKHKVSKWLCHEAQLVRVWICSKSPIV